MKLSIILISVLAFMIVKVTEIVSSILFQLIAVLKGMHQLQLVSLSNQK